MTKKKTHVRIDPKRSKPKRKTGKGKSIKKSRRWVGSPDTEEYSTRLATVLDRVAAGA